MIEKILEHNKAFVADRAYEKYAASKYPNKKLAIISCMDTRLVELLPAALGIKNGDVKLIKNAGGVVSHPYGSVVRSLLVAILELGVTEVMVIGHTDCGCQGMNSDEMIEMLLERGINQRDINMLKYSGIDFGKWLGGFDSVEESVVNTVRELREHPLIPDDVFIGGYIMDTQTGALTVLDCEA